MKCHYEVLELPRHADDGEIKSAYRKLALKWHPDKNPDKPDFAKEQFQIVQQAYEVLSDKQERAWYDAHRDQILHGAKSDFQDKSLDLFQYFTTTCFKGFADDDGGFYSVYRKVFDQIAKEDMEFMDGKEEFCEIPCFGRSDSDYESVKAFYDYWMSYATKKSYSWLDPYDIREGKGDRRLLKIIEKENNKARLKARKERNDEVRNLVAFARKRDKRVQAFRKEMEAKTLENRKKQEQLSKQKRLERKQMHANERQADWLKFDNVKSELEEIEKHLAQEFGEELSQSEDDEGEDFNNLYCVACNKIFKNPKAFENHESSKKHKENIEKLKASMLEIDLESDMTEDLEDYNDLKDNHDSIEETIEENGHVSCEDEETFDEIINEASKKKTYEKPEELEDFSDDNHALCKNEQDKVADNESDDDCFESVKKARKKNKKAKSVMNTPVSDLNDHVPDEVSISKVSDDEFDFGLSRNQRKKNKKPSSNKSKMKNTAASEPEEMIDTPVDLEKTDKVTMKRQLRKDKKSNKKSADLEDLNEIDIAHSCVTCKSYFPSKNKLFDHLKKTGHGVFLSSKAKQAASKK